MSSVNCYINCPRSANDDFFAYFLFQVRDDDDVRGAAGVGGGPDDVRGGAGGGPDDVRGAVGADVGGEVDEHVS